MMKMEIADELSRRLSSEARVAASGTEDFAYSDLRYTQYGRPVCTYPDVRGPAATTDPHSRHIWQLSCPPPKTMSWP